MLDACHCTQFAVHGKRRSAQVLCLMDQSRPSSPEQNLRGSILNSVSSSRSIPSGNVVVLGEPGTGKSTLINALLQKATNVTHHDGDWSRKNDFALGYEWANVKDEKDEGVWT